MPPTAKTRKTSATPSAKKAPAKPVKPPKSAPRKVAKVLPGARAERTRGLSFVAGAVAAAGLTDEQKRRLVRHCISRCTGVGEDDFQSDQPLSSIQQGRELCIESCIIDAIHRPMSIRSSDTEDRIVGRI